MAKSRLMISGPTETKEVSLDPKGMMLGRGSNCDIVLDDSGVSRHHARIYQDPFGRWIVEDLDSQNGVLIDGQRIKAQAVLPGQKIGIRPFTLSLSPEFDEQSATGTTTQTSIPIVDKGAEEDIVSYAPQNATILSPALMKHLNELTNHLLDLSRPSELYGQACSWLARILDTLVAIVRLPCSSEPLPKSPEILACHFGAGGRGGAVAESFYLHFSKRVLEAVRSQDVPVMASSRRATDRRQQLTIVDEYEPHLVYSARVHGSGKSVDALYIDILENKAAREMFDFVEAAARQIDFAQKNLFLTVLEKQERELREANTQLREKDRIKDEYVSRITHDIKGDLAAIHSCLYVAANEPSSSEKQADFLGRAFGRTIQLTDFIKELLNLTRMRLSGRMEMAPFSLPDCISKALQAVANRAKEKSITVTSDIEASVGEIVGNEFSITEMISNLLFNAVKYTPDGKSVHLEAKDKDHCVQVSVIDTGIGIPADEVGHVFDEFFRATNAKQREKDGTGLGLSIVKQIVDSHGGEISVQSKQGQGSKFTVVLPKKSSAPVCS
jgi:signal transduction histidine kinase